MPYAGETFSSLAGYIVNGDFSRHSYNAKTAWGGCGSPGLAGDRASVAGDRGRRRAAHAADADSLALFDRLDANHDGQLTTDEVPAEKERLLKRLLRTADADHDGKLSQQEFVAGLSAPPVERSKDSSPTENRGLPGMNSEVAFRRLDANGDGRVTSDEIPAERRENVSKLIERADTDADGAMSREEFDKIRPLAGRRRPAATETSAAANEASAAAAVFAALDADGDGSLSAEEIAKAPQSLAALDKDGNGTIAFAEIQQPQPPLAMVAKPGPDPARIWQRLLMADKDGDGRLSAEEAPERLQRNFERVDTNKDGFVEESEFKSSVARMRAALGNK